MTDWMRKVLESKRKTRQSLAALPFSQKLILLEKLRDRSLAIAASSLRHQRHRAERIVTIRFEQAGRRQPKIRTNPLD